MRIAIDAHHLGERRTGTETYVYNLVRNLALLEPNGDKYAIYLNSRQKVQDLDSKANFETRELPVSVRAIRYGLFYPSQSWRKRFDLFHAQLALPPLLRSRSVVTVHDLCYERFPHFFRKNMATQMKMLVPWSCRRADHIITVSKATKRDLVEIYRVNPDRITVTYEAARENCKPMCRETAQAHVQDNYGIDDPFILYLGNLEPRKNLGRLLEAFSELKRKGRIRHKLVIVGQKAWFYSPIISGIARNGLSSEVILTGYLPNHELPVFYNAAEMMVYPSIYEGFGLPVVEAMACGTPVITSLGSSLEEITDGAALLVDPYSVESIATAIEKLATEPDLQCKLRRASLVKAAQFSFRKMAEQTRAVYYQLS